LKDVESAAEVIKISENIMECLSPLIQVQDHSLHLTTSIGIAMFPNDGEDLYTLLKNADIALYQAKDSGRNRFQFYNHIMNLHSYAKLSLENDLRLATKRDEIVYYYQPIVDKDKKIIGTEALMRWNHPKLGLLQPGEFIGLAEETGIITQIGKAGNKKVWKEYQGWKKKFDFCCKVSINISTRQFAEHNFVPEIEKLLSELKLSPEDIELEITESIAMNNTERTYSKLKELKKLGIGISIDDFGTGYSSLSYLKNFPINRLKIDQSFVRHCMTNKQDRSIIKAIIAMGHSLGVEVIAEGIETEDQFKYLITEGCDGFQGYLFDKPIPSKEFLKWL
jgi:EAL domain-containing protein (putative c-di-GMP-specific phosphodiesterase class I)